MILVKLLMQENLQVKLNLKIDTEHNNPGKLYMPSIIKLKKIK